MWSTWYTKSRADLKQRWLQAAVLAIMLVTGTAAITLSFTVNRSTSRVIDGVHEEASGADVWLYGDPATLNQAATSPEVSEASPVVVTLNGELVHQGEVYDTSVWGIDGIPAASPGLLREGRWPSAARDDEVVIGSGLARDAGIRLGDRILLVAANSRAASYEVVGTVTTTFRVPFPQATPAAAFVSTRAMDGLVGGQATALGEGERAALGLDFALGATVQSPATLDRLLLAYPSLRVTTWQEVKQGLVDESAGPATMLRIFAIFSVLASGFVVAATITNHAMSQTREIGLLKAVGFTTRQTAMLLLAQLLAISVPAALLGILLGVAATPLFQWGVTDLLDATAVRSVSPSTVASVFVAVQVLVVVSALLPAWRAGRTRIVDAVAMGPRQVGAGASIIARAADNARLPQVVVVGVKDTFTRPMRSWMILAAIAVAAATLMMAFSFRYSLQKLTDDPALIGSKPYELQASRLGKLVPARLDEAGLPTAVMSHADANNLVATQPGVAAFVTDRSQDARIGDVDVITRAVGGEVSQMGFKLADGRLFNASQNEAVIGFGLAQKRDLKVGDEVSVEILPGQAAKLKVVGIYYADENDGLVLMYPLDTLRSMEASAEPGVFDLRLVDGVPLEDVKSALASASGETLVVSDLTREADANISEGRRLILPMTLLAGGLAVLAAANLLSSLVFSVRERRAEFGILKAIGVTPRQIVAVVMVGVAPLALVGTLVGAPVGYWLIDLLMRSQAEAHQPNDIIDIPSMPWLLALVAIALVISFVGAFLPAERAARLGVSEVLRAE